MNAVFTPDLFARIKNLVTFDNHAFRVIAPSEGHADYLSNIPGHKKPTKANPHWLIPDTVMAVQLLMNGGFAWNDEAQLSAIDILTTALDRLKTSEAAESEIERDFTGFGMNPFDYQKVGIDYMCKAERALVADEMGLGKSCEIYGFLHQTPDAFPALVVCLNSLKYWWKQEGERCFPDKRFVVADAKTKPLEIAMADVVIINYEMLADGWETAEKKNVILKPIAQILEQHPFKSIIGDEIHSIKSWGAQKSHATVRLAQGKRYRIASTGTPVSNSAMEMIPTMRFLDRLKDMGGYTYFTERYCKQRNRFKPYGGASHRKEMNERMRSIFYLRRTKKQVGYQLPKLTRSVVSLEIDNREEYEKAEKELIEWVKDKARQDREFLSKIEDYPESLREYMIEEHAHNKAARAKRAEAMIRIGALKDVEVRGILKPGLEWVDNFLEGSEEKLVIFATRKIVLEAIINHLQGRDYEVVSLTAEMDSKARMEAVNRFQNDKKVRVIVGAFGTSAGSAPAATGLTMTAACNLVFFDKGWTSTHHDQAEARCDRTGQTRPVTAYYLCGMNTIARDILQLLDVKRQMCAEITDGEAAEATPPLVDMLLERLELS